MFKKLRNRFLVVNLITISVLILVAFSAIYVITYRNVLSDINMELHRIVDNYQKIYGKSGPSRVQDEPSEPKTDDTEDGSTVDSDTADGAPPSNRTAPPERSLSFMVQTDKEGNMTAWSSKFSMDRAFYEQALQKAVSKNQNTGQFSLDGSVWVYTERPLNDGQMLVFLDVTSQREILIHLIYTFSLVGFGMLIALYFTSRYFANRAITPVKEAFEKQKQFIADASHELKTPLSIINTNADVLLANQDDSIRNQAKWLHYIRSETERMSKLTRDLLYLTEMDDARADLIFAKFNLSETVENVILTMEAVIFEKRLSLNYDIEPGLTVYGNSEQIKQVVMILLDNAVKYANPKGTITLSLKKQHNDAVLAVTNTGKGIPPEHLPRIFDRFYRTDASRARKQGGYGLGLAIAKSIVEQHKGRIYAKSAVGESTTFYVHLS